MEYVNATIQSSYPQCAGGIIHLWTKCFCNPGRRSFCMLNYNV